jgi:hypothetical protein
MMFPVTRLFANWCVSSACRSALRVAAWLVPAELYDDWRREWRGDLWLWTLDAAESGAPDARWALLIHTRESLRHALRARFRSDPGREEVHGWLGSPAFCLALGVLSVIAVGVASRGFVVTRQLAAGLPYRDAQRVVVLAQGPPVFGIRLGFRDAETAVFRAKSTTLASVAAYSWHTAAVSLDHGRRLVQSANVDSSFFDVLGVRAPVERLSDDEVLVSDDFWRQALSGDPNRVGQFLTINGRPMRLAGVLPRDFSFLSAPIAIWTSRAEPVIPAPPRRWWLNLRGVVARLNPGATPDAARRELHELLMQSGLGRRNFEFQATPIEDLVLRALRSYAGDLAIVLGALFAWATLRFVLDRRAGAPAKRAARFWGFFALKTALPLAALFFAIVELTDVNTLGLTGGDPGRGGPLLVWASFACVVVILVWAFRDQPVRCRVCLQRLRQPVRIGVPGQMLLETAGQEVMCPRGHGSVYTSASVLGADISDRWMGLDLEFDGDLRLNDDARSAGDPTK